MVTDNWINLISAIVVGTGTLVLGIMAWRSIRQTRSMQKAEKRERLLNEIIEWAENIGKCAIDPYIELYLDYRIAGVYDKTEVEDDKGKPEHVVAAEIKHRKQLLSNILRYSKKNKYMSLIAPKINNKLDNAIREVINNLEQQITLLRASLLDVEHTSTTNISIQMEKITKSIDKLIENATNIKTKNIG